MVKIVQGDLLKAKVDIICHQVNCQGVMGRGLALDIRNLYPEVFDEYLKLCLEENPKDLLGYCQIVNLENGNYVANLFGQFGYGLDRQYTNYIALEKALTNLLKCAELYNLSIGIPFGIGCVNGGGDWLKVHSDINRIFKNYDNVAIYIKGDKVNG